MNQRSSDIPEPVLKFAPKDKARDASGSTNPTDQAGHALIAMLQQAAKISNDNCDRAMSLAHKLSVELRAAEDRMKQLEAEADHFRDRAARAEGWLQRIQKEVEEKLLNPNAGIRPELSALH